MTPMKPDKEPDMREACPCCAYDKSREVDGMEKCYSCGCKWYTGTIKRHCHPAYQLATIQGDIATSDTMLADIRMMRVALQFYTRDYADEFDNDGNPTSSAHETDDGKAARNALEQTAKYEES